MTESIVFALFIIFTGAALLSTAALYTRQSLLVAYIIIGCILGPSGLGVIANGSVMKSAGSIGIIFLLFLLGLELQPQKFLHALKKTASVTLISSIIFFGIGYGICFLFQYTPMECLIVGISTMFSSTIIGLKLLPSNVLHHRHIGELMISVLLAQDLIAIVVLVLLSGMSNHGVSVMDFLELAVSFPLLIAVAFLVGRFILTPCLNRFGETREYVFLLAIGWCLGLSQLAHWMGLSEEVGAFVAGVTLAAHSISHYLVDNLKPLRDFFLVMFFFSIGAEFNFSYLGQIIWPALFLGAVVLIAKPFLYSWLFQKKGEKKPLALEIGVRLGQGSEFSLLLGNLAVQATMIHIKTSYLIQASMILTFIISSYWVVLRYPTGMTSNNEIS